jgi:hypothetical protein
MAEVIEGHVRFDLIDPNRHPPSEGAKRPRN